MATESRFFTASRLARIKHFSRARVRGLTNTYVFVNNSPMPTGMGVEYYATVVAWKDDETGCITLRSGGWYTATTARRMNSALALFGATGWRVSRSRGMFVLTGPDGSRKEWLGETQIVRG